MEVENTRFEVLTTDGFKDFSGITLLEKETYLLQLENQSIECTADHRFFSGSRNQWVQLRDIEVGELVQTFDGFQKNNHLSR